MNFFPLYIIVGIFFVILEHRCYEWSELDDMNLRSRSLNIIQQFIHYSRYVLTWPWYLLEDFVMWLDDIEEEKDET